MSKFGIGATLANMSTLNTLTTHSNTHSSTTSTVTSSTSHITTINVIATNNNINSNTGPTVPINNNPLSALSTIVLSPKGPLKPQPMPPTTLPVQPSFPHFINPPSSPQHNVEITNPPIITTTL